MQACRLQMCSGDAREATSLSFEIIGDCRQGHGVENAVVLDPFLGAGTTLIAAEQLGMRGIGIEVDRHYAEIASERLRDEIDCANR